MGVGGWLEKLRIRLTQPARAWAGQQITGQTKKTEMKRMDIVEEFKLTVK